MNPLKRLWQGWKEIAGYIGDFQSRLLLTIFYFTVLVPFGLIVRLFSDPLHIKVKTLKSGWTEREAGSTQLSDARRQF